MKRPPIADEASFWLTLILTVSQLLGLGSIFALLNANSAASVEADRLDATPFWAVIAVVVVLICGIAVSAWFMAIYFKNSRFKDPPYQIKNAVFSLVVEENRIVSRADFEVQARKDGVRYYEGRYCWTGASVPSFDLIAPPNGHILPTGSRHPWRYYQVYFSAPLNKGQSVRVVVDRILPKEAFECLISKTVVENMDDLSLEIEYKDGTLIKTIAENLLRTSFDEYPKNVSLPKIPSAGVTAHRWTVTGKPKRGACYQLVWTTSN